MSSQPQNKEVYFDTLDRNVLKCIAQENGICVAEIARRLGKPETTVRYRVKTLVRGGLIRVERTRWKIRCYLTEKSPREYTL